MNEVQRNFVVFLFFLFMWGISMLCTAATFRYPRVWAFFSGLFTAVVLSIGIKLFGLMS